MKPSLQRHLLLLSAAALALSLSACGTTITAVHLPDAVQVNVGATAETAATYDTEKQADAESVQAAAGKIDWTWTVADTDVAAVDAGGVVTGLKGGNTTITLTSADGKLTAECPVTVCQPLQAIHMDDIALETNGRNSAAIQYTLDPADTTEDDVTLTVADESVAKLDGDKVTAVANGTTTITAACGAVTATAQVTVSTKAENITLDKTEGILYVGGSTAVTATVTPDNASNAAVTWTSDNETVATVDSTGKVTAVSAGSATITAAVENGDVKAAYALTVQQKPPPTKTRPQLPTVLPHQTTAPRPQPRRPPHK